MAPEGPVAPSGPPRPDLDSRELSEHFRSRARLCRLLVGLRPPTLQRSLRSLRQGGFALYVRLRHYRSSLFCYRKIIPSHSFAALTALIVRRVNRGVALFMHCVNGLADQPMPASTSRRATPKGVERTPGGGTLPPLALFRQVRRQLFFVAGTAFPCILYQKIIEMHRR